MKKLARIISLIIIVVLIIPTSFAAGDGTGEAEYSHAVELMPGLIYKNEISHNASGSRVETYKLDYNHSSSVHPIVLSSDKVINAMTINEITDYATDLGYTVLGAVNADFFIMQSYLPLGIVIENGIYKSSPNNYNALCFTDEGAIVVQKPKINLRFSNGRTGDELILEHLNKGRNDLYGIFVFTSDYSETTETFTEGWAVRCKITSGEMRIGSELKLSVSEIIENGKNYVLNEGEIILSASATSDSAEGYNRFAVGDDITLDIESEDEQLKSVNWATGCGNILVMDGEITDDKTWDSALFGLNPRTAVGIREDGSFVTYTVDGRNASHSVGARLSEVAKDLISEGCVIAVNMDGGGSTAINVKKPGYEKALTIDEPSTNRKCSTYILFVTEDQPKASAQKLYLSEDGAYILAGSDITLHYFYTDNLLNQIGDTISKTSKAPTTSGAFKTPDAGLVYVVTPDECEISIINTDVGKNADFKDIESGGEVQLNVKALKLNREVLFDSSSVLYSATGCANVDSNGLVSILGSAGDKGTVTVNISSFSKTFDVNIPLHFEDMRNHWSKDFVETIYREGIVVGYPDGGFHPNDQMTRGNFTLMLYRAMGNPEVTGISQFTDVASDKYYYDAILWAEHNGIAIIGDNNAFSPDDAISREEAFTMLARTINVSSSDTSKLFEFRDSNEISEYAIESVSALVNTGIIVGSNNSLFPKNTITRGEMSKIISLAFYS